MRTLLLSGALIVFQIACFSQTTVTDSLLERIHHSNDPKEKLALLLAFCSEYQSLNRDTLYYYATIARDLAEQSGDKKSKDLAYIALANAYYRWGWTDSSTAFIDPVIEGNDPAKREERELYFNALRQKAVYIGSKNKLPEALDILYKLTSLADRYHDTAAFSANANTIASISLARGAPYEALTWLSQALNYLGNSSVHDKIRAAIFSNYCEAYLETGKTDSALMFNRKAVELYTREQLLYGLAITYQRQAAIFTRLSKYGEAEKSLKEMIRVRSMLNDGSMYIDDNLSLINFYLETKQVDSAIALCFKNLVSGDIYAPAEEKNATLLNTIAFRIPFYEALVKCYQQKKDFVATADVLQKIILAKDSLNALQQESAIAEVQTRYEVQKKETTIIQQQLDLAKKNSQMILYGSLTAIALAGGFLFFMNSRKKQHERSARAVLEAEENERKRIAADLHDNLGVQANALVYSSELLKQDPENAAELAVRLNDTSKEMLFFLRETLWALKHVDTSASALWIRVLNFAGQLRRHYGKIHFLTTGAAPENFHLSSARALHVMMIVQEAVNNAIRHSGGNEIQVSSETSDEKWRVSVRDNGKGFLADEENNNNESNGLVNMRRRAEAAGIVLTIAGDNGPGTLVELKILPLT